MFFNARVYIKNSTEPAFDISRIPEKYVLRIDLDYTSGSKIVVIYDEMPADKERMELMWKLQRGASIGDFTVTVTDEEHEMIFAAEAI